MAFTVEMQARSNGIGLIMTNISSCTCTISSGPNVSLAPDVFVTADEDVVTPEPIIRVATVENDTKHGNIWIEWDVVEEACVASVTVASCGDTIYIGEMVGGGITEIRCPDYGFTEDMFDRQPPVILENGVPYIIDEGRRRVFSAEWSLQRRNEYYTLIDAFSDIGARPVFWRLTGLRPARWLVFGSLLTDLPKSRHGFNRSQVALKIKEL